MKIGDKHIGDGYPTYVIAEIGINHNGDILQAKQLIDNAISAGADAVKFQIRHLDQIYTADMLSNLDKQEWMYQYTLDWLKKTELSYEQHQELREYCSKRIHWICTPYDTKSLQDVVSLKPDAIKIAANMLSNKKLVEQIVECRYPMIISIGRDKLLYHVSHVESLLQKNIVKALYLYCVSLYPPSKHHINLSQMSDIKKRGDRVVGYSSHDIGLFVPTVAVAMGANAIEKHITLNWKGLGPDHRISLTKNNFKLMIKHIRNVEIMTSKQYVDRFSVGEELNKELFGTGIYTTQDIGTNEIITSDKIELRSPLRGVPASKIDSVLNKKSEVSIGKGMPLRKENLTRKEIQLDPPPESEMWGMVCRIHEIDNLLAFLQYPPRILEIRLTYQDLKIAETCIKKLLPFQGLLNYITIHAPEYTENGFFNIDSEEKIIKQVEKIAYSLGKHFKTYAKIIFHVGAVETNDNAVQNNDYESWKEYRLIGEFLKKQFIFLDKGTVRPLLENLPPYAWLKGGSYHHYLFVNPEKIARFCSEYGINLCLDISHAALWCNVHNWDLIRYIQIVKPYIRHIHYADARGIDGEGLQIGEGDINWKAVLKELGGLYGVGYVPEIWRGHLHNYEGFKVGLNRLWEIKHENNSQNTDKD